MERSVPIPRGKWGLVALAAVAFAAGGLVFGGEGPRQDDGKVAALAEPASVWTCSMHPQIRLPEPGKCPICSMDLIPQQAHEEDQGGPRELSVSDRAAALMELLTTPVERRFAKVEVRLVGKVTYDETRMATITAWVPGRLERLFVDYAGATVRQGDDLVELYSPELLTAQEGFLQAVAALDRPTDASVPSMRRAAAATAEASREKLRLWGLTAGQIEAIAQRGTASDRVAITAPVRGVVVHMNARQGAYVKTGAQLYTIADLTRVWVELDAYESDLPWVRQGQEVVFSAEAHPGQTYRGTIAFIPPVLDEKSRTVKVRVNVENPHLKLKPGMFVRARVQAPVAEAPTQAPLVIPRSAPLITGRRAVVYVEVPGRDRPTYEGRAVILGPRAGEYYTVVAGLSEGERVVVNGAFKLDAELQIRARPSMMSPEGNTAPAAGAFTGQLEGAVEAYLGVQAALAADDGGRAAELAAAGVQALASVDAPPGRGADRAAWVSRTDSLRQALHRLSSAADIDEARQHFRDASRQMLAAVRHFGASDGPLYQAYCPMAFDFAGAAWLQDSEEIGNPYFGASMLRCGTIQEVFE